MQIKTLTRVKEKGEVFTAPQEVKAICDLVPLESFKQKILEPSCGTGNFLIEILSRKLSLLPPLVALKTLYAVDICPENIATSKERIISLLKDNHVKIDDAVMDILTKNILCSDGLSNYSLFNYETNTFFSVKEHKGYFSAIIGNPPYQQSTNKTGNQAKPLYPEFFNFAKQLDPQYIAMIIPSRWFVGGWGGANFRNSIIDNLTVLVEYQDSKLAFPDNDIKGGVCYFLWDKNAINSPCLVSSTERNGTIHHRTTVLKEEIEQFGLIFKDNTSKNIVQKTLSYMKNNNIKPFASIASSLNIFNIPSNFKGEKGDCVVVLKKNGKASIDSNHIKQKELLSEYKLIVSKASEGKSYPNKVISSPFIIKPNQVCSHSHFVLYHSPDKEKCEQYLKFFRKKESRFLISLLKNTQDFDKNKLRFLPQQIDYTLIFSQEEIDFMHKQILD